MNEGGRELTDAEWAEYSTHLTDVMVCLKELQLFEQHAGRRMFGGSTLVPNQLYDKITAAFDAFEEMRKRLQAAQQEGAGHE